MIRGKRTAHGSTKRPTKPSIGQLVRDSNGDVVGSVRIDGPSGSRPRLLQHAKLTSSGDGISGADGSLLVIPVQVGTAAGTYVLSVSLTGGGSARVTIIAQ